MKLRRIINIARIVNGVCLLLFGLANILRIFKIGGFTGIGNWVMLVFVILALIQVVIMAINIVLIPEKKMKVKM